MLFDELKTNLAAPLSGMGVSFSASLFGLAGSLVLGFLDLQAGQAQNRFYTELEDWLATAASPDGPAAAPGTDVPGEVAAALDRLTAAMTENHSGTGSAAPSVTRLADGVQALVGQMRAEQQLVRDWVEAQAARESEFKALLQRLARDRIV